jgi:NADH-quinone oxidoreductase subunit L
MVNPQAELLRWIPMLPLLAASLHGVMIGVLRRSAPRWLVIGLSCGVVLVSFLLSCEAFYQLTQLPPDARFLSDTLYTWIGAGIGAERLTADLAFRLDPLSAVMTLVVTGVGLLIHLYSVGYMDDDHREDKGFQRFFCYLNLFTAAMLVLVLADNLALMFVGWEGVGLCSYLLIGFWYSDRFNAYCGSKAFIVNRIGDFGFLIGIFLLFRAFVQAGVPATLSFAELAQGFDAVREATLSVPLLGASFRLVNVVGLCFFVGACGKSAQIPLYVWLPDAMAGPTPVSALIHAATMVTAGVYMVCRLSFLFAAAETASAVIAWIGALTAFFAATIAITQTDIKKVLAYSTVSQLGYMFLAAGCGGYTGAIFHLVTHAFFKALLFLAAGSVILAMHHEQDIDHMGGLWGRLKQTRWVFLVGVLAIAGVPPLSGFFSKDEILVAAYTAHVPGHFWLYAIGLVTAGITSFYMFRLFFRTFSGESRAPAHVRDSVHEPSSWVLEPLWVLAVLAFLGGAIGIPQIYGDWLHVESSHSLNNFLSPLFPVGAADHLEQSTEYTLALSAIGFSALGLLASWWIYVRSPALAAQLAQRLRGLYTLLTNKYWIDELYDAIFVRPLVRFSDAVLFRTIDAGIIDGIAVNGMARGVRGLADHGLKYLQTGLAQSYVFLMIVGTVAILEYLLR